MRAPKDYIIRLLKEGKRLDNRKMDEFRKPLKIEYGISNQAEGSARVTLGETIVIAGVKMAVGEPYADSPEEGSIIVNAELLPLASPDFEPGPPSSESIELARVVDRGIRESNAINMEKLCIKAGEKMWMVFIDIYPINNAGNLQDASALAALAALSETKIPAYNEKEDKIDYTIKKEKLPLMKRPIEVTLIKIGDEIIADPSVAEEEVMDARLTVAVTEDNMLCALQKGGKQALTSKDIEKMTSLAIKKSAELRKAL